MQTKIKKQLTAICFVIALIGGAVIITEAQVSSNPPYTIEQSVIASGGGQGASGGTFSLDGTIGQFAAGTTSVNTPFYVSGGFWTFDPFSTLTANSQSVSTSEDISVAVTLTATDPSNATLTYSVVSNPAHGLISGDGANLIYQPDADFNGNDSFTFKVSNGSAESPIAAVSINISEVNDVPVTVNDVKTTAYHTALNFAATDLTANDIAGPSNESSQTLTVMQVTAIAKTNGQVSLSNGQITYQPNVGFSGAASFNYQVCDNGTTVGEPDPKCATGTVNVTVGAGQNFSISVTVSNSDGALRAGINVSLSCNSMTFNDNAVTDVNGSYTFSGIFEGSNCTVAPPSQGFTFSPSSRTYNNLAANATGVNFTITAATILISEFRFHGITAADEFVELYNAAATPADISGWSLVASDNPAFAAYIVPANTVIPAKGHYLVVGSEYSLNGFAPGDGIFNASLPDGGGIALHNVASGFTAATRVDAVGFMSAPAEFRKRAGLLPVGGITQDGQSTFNRKFNGSEPSERYSNAVDFHLLANDGATYGGIVAILGAPGPQNLASPTMRDDAQMTITLLDPRVSENAAPNRQRVGDGMPRYMLLRRTVTNNTGAAVTRLRFRITQISTLNNRTITAANVEAELRAASSVTETVMDSQGLNVTVNGLTLDSPPSNIAAGGMNSSLNADEVVTLAQPLLPGQSINVNLKLNVIYAGTYTFVVVAEAIN